MCPMRYGTTAAPLAQCNTLFGILFSHLPLQRTLPETGNTIMLAVKAGADPVGAGHCKVSSRRKRRHAPEREETNGCSQYQRTTHVRGSGERLAVALGHPRAIADDR